jgi:hypothetical protein
MKINAREIMRHQFYDAISPSFDDTIFKEVTPTVDVPHRSVAFGARSEMANALHVEIGDRLPASIMVVDTTLIEMLQSEPFELAFVFGVLDDLEPSHIAQEIADCAVLGSAYATCDVCVLIKAATREQLELLVDEYLPYVRSGRAPDVVENRERSHQTHRLVETPGSPSGGRTALLC